MKEAIQRATAKRKRKPAVVVETLQRKADVAKVAQVNDRTLTAVEGWEEVFFAV